MYKKYSKFAKWLKLFLRLAKGLKVRVGISKINLKDVKSVVILDSIQVFSLTFISEELVSNNKVYKIYVKYIIYTIYKSANNLWMARSLLFNDRTHFTELLVFPVSLVYILLENKVLLYIYKLYMYNYKFYR